MLNSEELRFAIEDSRTRHEAIVALIYWTDQQAMALLALYVTLGLATAGGFIFGITQESMLPPALLASLFAATVMLTLGALTCFYAMQTAVFNLPGRQAEFWLWADSPKIKVDDAYREYLRNLQNKHGLNDGVNFQTSLALRRARMLGVFTPVSALIAGFVVVLWPQII
jgi:hypothetical protein